MDANSTPEPLGDVLPAPPARADEEHPLGSSDEENDSDEKGGESINGTNDELATLDVDDDFDEGEEPLPLKMSTGYVLGSSSPAALTAELVKRPIVLRLGIGRLKGTSRGRQNRAPAPLRLYIELLSTAMVAYTA